MPTPNPFPLEIVNKVNSPELLAFLQQFGHDKYADATDINKILQALQFIYENLGGSAISDLTKFIVRPTIDISGTAVLVSDDGEWLINGVPYAQTEGASFSFSLNDEGNQRFVFIIAGTDGNYNTVEGEQSATNPASPTLPLNCLLVSIIFITDSTITEIPLSAIADLIDPEGDNQLTIGPNGKLYINVAAGSVPDATESVKGKIKLAGDLGGTADAPTVPALADKVDKVSGKSLSTNDFTDIDKDKLDNLSNYTGFRTAQPSLAAVASAAGTGVAGDWAIITNPSGNAYFAIWDTDVNAWVEAGQSPTIPGTNLAYTVSGNTLTITSDTGNDVSIPLATASAAGLQSKEDKSKLDGIAAGATNFTVANVLATVLSGLSLATGGAIVSTDTVLVAFGKIQKQLNDGFTTSNIKTLLGITTLSGSNTGDQDLSGLEPKTVSTTGSVISFATPQVYNTTASPSSSNFTDDLTGARIGVIQKIYSNKGTTPTFPAGWVLIGANTYTTSVLNIIYAEWVSGSRVEYWIVKG